jgi:hypothetical protein
MTTDQIHHLIDVLDEVLRQEEPNYTEWCSAGNDPTDHLWYRTANAASVLEQASYIYNPSKPATFTPPRSLNVQRPTEAEWIAWAGKDKIMGDIDTPNAEESYP